MPVNKVGNKYRWGTKGKLYPTKAQALAQGIAIKTNQSKRIKKK